MNAEPDPCADGADCAKALRRLDQYLDGELPDLDLVHIREHLADCYPCADRATFEEQLRALVRERCSERAPDELIDRIRLRLDELSTS